MSRISVFGLAPTPANAIPASRQRDVRLSSRGIIISLVGLRPSGAAPFDGVAFGAPAQHAAGEVGNITKARFPQDDGRLRGAAAGAADGNDRTIARQLFGALGELAQRDQDSAANVPEGSDELFGFPHVEDLDRRRLFLEPVRINLPD